MITRADAVEMRKVSRENNMAVKTLVGIAVVSAVLGVILVLLGATQEGSYGESDPNFVVVSSGLGLLTLAFWTWVGLLLFWAWRFERRTAPPWGEWEAEQVPTSDTNLSSSEPLPLE